MIGGAHDDDPFASVEAVQLLEQRVDDAIVLRLGKPAAGGRGAAADAVHLVDEDHAGRVLAGELEQPLDAAHADADELVGEIAAGHRDEARAAFAGQCTREHGLARARIAFQDDASGCLRAEPREAGGLLQVSDDVLQRFLGFLHADHVVEARGGLGFEGEQLGTAQHVAHHEDQDDQDRQLQQHGQSSGAQLFEQANFRAQRRLQIVAHVHQMVRSDHQRVREQLGCKLVLCSDVDVVALTRFQGDQRVGGRSTGFFDICGRKVGRQHGQSLFSLEPLFGVLLHGLRHGIALGVWSLGEESAQGDEERGHQQRSPQSFRAGHEAAQERVSRVWSGGQGAIFYQGIDHA